MDAAVQERVAFMPEDMDSWRRGTAVRNSRLHSSDASRLVNSRFFSSGVVALSLVVVLADLAALNSLSSPTRFLRFRVPSALTRITSSWSVVIFLTLTLPRTISDRYEGVRFVKQDFSPGVTIATDDDC